MWMVTSGEYDDYHVDFLVMSEDEGKKALDILNTGMFDRYSLEPVKLLRPDDIVKIHVIKWQVGFNLTTGKQVDSQLFKSIQNVWSFELDVVPLKPYWTWQRGTATGYLTVIATDLDDVITMYKESSSRLLNEPELREKSYYLWTAGEDATSKPTDSAQPESE